VSLELASSSMRDDRTPPHSMDAEMAVLGGVLLVPRVLEETADLRVDDFFLPAHREIFEAMLALNKRNAPIDVITLADELKTRGVLPKLDGGETYLLKLANIVPTAENIRHYVKLVATKAMQRKVIVACAEISSAAYGDWYEPEDLLSGARQKFAGIELPDTAGPVRIGTLLDSTLASMEERAKSPGEYFIQTGLIGFDETIGNLRGGNLIVIATRPGMGKSAWVLDIALHNASIAVPVLIFSFEMDEVELIERSLSKKASVNGRKIVSGRLNVEEWGRVEQASQRLHPIPLYLSVKPMNAARICSEARRWRSQQNTKRAIIAIDYLGLVKSAENDERNRAQEVSGMTRQFKLLAKELNDPVFLLSQLNREGVKAGRRPKLSDLRDSGAIEQDADTVIFPWWEGTPPLRGRHPATLIVDKNRGGGCGDVQVDWEAEFVRFSDVQPGGYQLGPAQGELL